MLRLFTLIAVIGLSALSVGCADVPEDGDDGDSKGIHMELIDGAAPCSEINESEADSGC